MRWVGRHTERAHVGCGLLISLYTRRTPFRSSSSGHGSVLTVKFSLVSWRAPSVRLWSRFTSRCRLRLRRICFWWVRFRSERNRTVRSHGENYDFYQHRAPEMKSISPVVGHVALDEVSCSQSRHQGELPRQHGAAHHPGQLTGVLTRLAGARALNPEHLQTQTQFNVRERRWATRRRITLLHIQKHLFRISCEYLQSLKAEKFCRRELPDSGGINPANVQSNLTSPGSYSTRWVNETHRYLE